MCLSFGSKHGPKEKMEEYSNQLGIAACAIWEGGLGGLIKSSFIIEEELKACQLAGTKNEFFLFWYFIGC